MPPALEEPTTRVTFVAFAKDIELLRKRYGTGWSEQIRLMVRKNCKEYLEMKARMEDYHG